jgi:hypothetical protein
MHVQVACRLHVAYIDERAASKKSPALAEEYYHRLKAVVQTLDSLYGSINICCIEDALGANQCPHKKQQDLKDKLASSKDETSRQCVIRALRQQVLLSEARKLGCNKILVGDNSTGLAARFVSMAAQVCHILSQHLQRQA